MTIQKQQYADHVGLVHFHAKRGYKWAKQCGLTMDYDDMVQEASVAFVIASEGFNPDAGVKFSAYFTQVAFSQFRIVIGKMTGVKNLNPTQRKEIADRKEENVALRLAGKQEMPAISYGLQPASFSDISADGESDSFESSVASSARTPEEVLEFRQVVDQQIKKLSPYAQIMVDWIKDPPPELSEEIERCRAFSRASNEVPYLSDELSINTVGRFLGLVAGLSVGQIAAVKSELFKLMKNVDRECDDGYCSKQYAA